MIKKNNLFFPLCEIQPRIFVLKKKTILKMLKFLLYLIKQKFMLLYVRRKNQKSITAKNISLIKNSASLSILKKIKTYLCDRDHSVKAYKPH